MKKFLLVCLTFLSALLLSGNLNSNVGAVSLDSNTIQWDPSVVATPFDRYISNNEMQLYVVVVDSYILDEDWVYLDFAVLKITVTGKASVLVTDDRGVISYRIIENSTETWILQVPKTLKSLGFGIEITGMKSYQSMYTFEVIGFTTTYKII